MTNLLLVDASPMTRRFLELTFAREEVRITAAVDGLNGMDLARAERPDVVVADHQAAGVSGYELASRFKQEPGLSRIPVLLLAGAYDEVDADRVASCGCAGVLVKPLDPAALVARVRQLMRPDPLPPRVPAENVAQPPRNTEAPGTVEELFERLNAVLGERRRAPIGTQTPKTQEDPSEGAALLTLDRLLGSDAADAGRGNTAAPSSPTVLDPQQNEGSQETDSPPPSSHKDRR